MRYSAIDPAPAIGATRCVNHHRQIYHGKFPDNMSIRCKGAPGVGRPRSGSDRTVSERHCLVMSDRTIPRILTFATTSTNPPLAPRISWTTGAGWVRPGSPTRVPREALGIHLGPPTSLILSLDSDKTRKGSLPKYKCHSGACSLAFKSNT